MTTQIIEEKIDELIGESKKYSDVSRHHLFGALCCKYIFFDGEYSYPTFNRSFVDGSGDGGNDFIIRDDSGRYSDERLVIVQSKYYDSFNNIYDYEKEASKAIDTFKNFTENKSDKYSRKLKKVFQTILDDIETDSPTKLIAFVTTTKLNDSKKNEIKEHLREFNEEFEYELYDANDIEAHIRRVEEPKEFVTEDHIRFYSDEGMIETSVSYSGVDLEGYVVNIPASELKRLFNKYDSEGGLFAQNNRFFQPLKKIDDKVKKSISNHPQLFWYNNNGVIIACKKVIPDGNKLKIYDFSIINGCQTTNLLSKTIQHLDDVKVLTKIIQAGNNTDLISRVAEASNSQKPIKDRDLKSNTMEQRKLKEILKSHSPPVFVSIKRGDKLKKVPDFQAWQYTANDIVGKLILSFDFQMPGTARSATSKIFANDQIYDKIFCHGFNADKLCDQLLLLNAVKEFIKDSAELGDEYGYSGRLQDIIANSETCLVALVGYITKFIANKEIIKITEISQGDADHINSDLANSKIEGYFFNQKIDSFDQLLHGLLLDLSQSVIERSIPDEGVQISNFLKLDSNYRLKIISEMKKEFINPIRRDTFNKNYGALFTKNI